MKLLGLDNKPLVAGGKAIIPPSAGSSVDIQLGTITPDRYTVDTDNVTAFLNLGGLITGKYFVCRIEFIGESADGGTFEPSGTENGYILDIVYIDDLTLDETNSAGYCCGPQGFAAFPITFVSDADHVLDLSLLLEFMKNDTYGMALNMTSVHESVIVSWD